MFCNQNGYCPLDLWSPGVRTKVSNVAFSAYAKHTQEMEDIIEKICASARMGQIDLTITLDDCFSAEDWNYIKEEVNRRLG